jgi:hypothetical protein
MRADIGANSGSRAAVKQKYKKQGNEWVRKERRYNNLIFALWSQALGLKHSIAIVVN